MICEKCKSEFKIKRTVQQNKFLHKVFSIIAEHTGYSLNEIKTLMKHEFGFCEEVKNKKTGEILINYLSTADLSKKEFADFTEKVINFAGSHGLNILSPEQYFET